MCGRFFLNTLPGVIEGTFEVRVEGPFRELLEPRFNIAPGQRVAIVRHGRNGRELAGATWGLIPAWSDDPTFANRTVNARSETAWEKPAFREAAHRRRCLIPSNGFYEWKQGPGGKQPLAMSLSERGDDRALHAMAGLWERWTNRQRGEERETCTILTCAANEHMEGIHPRMPVIAPRDRWQTWLTGSDDEARSVCVPYPSEDWRHHPVSTRVNSVRNDGPELLEPVIDESGGLFG